MFTLRKFLYCCVVLGALAFLGSTLLQMAANQRQPNVQGLTTAFGSFLQTASNEASPATDRTISDLSFKLRIFSNSARLLVDRNEIEARLELAYMANTVRAEMSTASSIPTTPPGWLKDGPQVAIQNAAPMARNLAGKVPGVSSAINVTRNSFATLRAGGGF